MTTKNWIYVSLSKANALQSAKIVYKESTKQCKTESQSNRKVELRSFIQPPDFADKKIEAQREERTVQRCGFQKEVRQVFGKVKLSKE